MTLETHLNSPEWLYLLQDEFEKPYWKDLSRFLDRELSGADPVYPQTDRIFSIFESVPPKSARVVILGQDPYHGAGQAHGLAFSVPDGVKPPPSLKNILKEIREDIGRTTVEGGNLTAWARQGVFLLNAVLTVRQGQANSHRNKGWERFTDRVIQILSESGQPKIFLLWGNPARKKQSLIDKNRNLVLTTAHPSPLSAYRGFFGSGQFSETNKILNERGEPEIVW